MILNIIPEDKFLPFLQGIFEEALPGQYSFRVVASGSQSDKTPTMANTEFVGKSYFFTQKFRADASKASCVIIHNLTVVHALALLRLPASIPIIWRGWGCDYYELMRKEGAVYLLEETQKLCNQQSFASRLWRKLSSPQERFPFLLNRLFGRSIFRKALPRISYFSSCVPDEIVAVKSRAPHLTASYIQLNYYSSEDVFLKGAPENVDGENILLGNSATPTNNHADAIKHLAKIGVGNRKLITPLSYGDSNYAKNVIDYGNEKLGEAFLPLNKYMPLEDYNATCSSCSNVIMNHVRQQGIGNVSAALLRGAKVYLRKENPIYNYYRSLGAHIYSFPEECTKENLSTKLDKAKADINKNIMESHWCRNVALDNLRSLNDKVTEANVSH